MRERFSGKQQPNPKEEEEEQFYEEEEEEEEEDMGEMEPTETETLIKKRKPKITKAEDFDCI